MTAAGVQQSECSSQSAAVIEHSRDCIAQERVDVLDKQIEQVIGKMQQMAESLSWSLEAATTKITALHVLCPSLWWLVAGALGGFAGAPAGCWLLVAGVIAGCWLLVAGCWC